MAIRRFYFWCSCGRYHDEVHCPDDGSSRPEAQDIVRAATRLTSAGRSLSIEHLRGQGISEEALRYVLVADVGDERCSFDAVSPDELGWRRPGRRVETTHPRVVVRLYFLCSGCDDSDALYSQLDAWSSPVAKDIASTATRLTSTGQSVSIERLRAEGVSEAALRRLIVVEFGDEWAAFRFLHIRRSA